MRVIAVVVGLIVGGLREYQLAGMTAEVMEIGQMSELLKLGGLEVQVSELLKLWWLEVQMSELLKLLR